MALGFGANARFLAAFESTYGTPPADGYTAVQLARYGIAAKQNLLGNDLLGTGRDPAAPVLGADVRHVQRFATEPRSSLAFQPRGRERGAFDRVEMAEGSDLKSNGLCKIAPITFPR